MYGRLTDLKGPSRPLTLERKRTLVQGCLRSGQPG
jgi:hypothetical protein